MLVLSRRVGEKILFPEQNIVVQVLAVKGGAIRLGIDAPPEVKVFREELSKELASASERMVSAATTP
jgi:carbon storage regulator